MGEVLHLSQACLHPDAPAGSTAKVIVEQGGQGYAIASLREGGQEFCALDLFFSQSDVTFKVMGKASVDLTGYFEPDADGMMDDEDEEEEEKATTAPLEKSSPKASPKAVEAPKSSPKAAAAASPKVASPKATPPPKTAPEEDEEGEEEEEEEEEEE